MKFVAKNYYIKFMWQIYAGNKRFFCWDLFGIENYQFIVALSLSISQFR